MRTTAIEIEDKVEELLEVLDRDIRHLRESLQRLNELRSLVIKRDEVSLGELLERMRSELSSYRSNERRRQVIRRDLATAFGCRVEEMTMSRLEAELAGEKRAEVAEKKALLRSLTEEVKREHLSTALLLSDCARFNNMLLRCVFDLGKREAVTYSSNGSEERQDDAAFLNFRS